MAANNKTTWGFSVIILAKNPPNGAIKLANTARTSEWKWMGRHLSENCLVKCHVIIVRKRNGQDNRGGKSTGKKRKELS